MIFIFSLLFLLSNSAKAYPYQPPLRDPYERPGAYQRNVQSIYRLDECRRLSDNPYQECYGVPLNNSYTLPFR